MLLNTLSKNIVLLFIGLSPMLAIAETTATPATTLTTPSLHDLNGQQLYDIHPWMLTYYNGIGSKTSLIQILSGNFVRWPENVQSVELAKTLDENNWFRRLVSPLVGVVQLAGNVAIRHGKNENTIYEVDPYIAFRWANFPWNDYVTTSLAIGEGVSYASSVPWVEKRNNHNVRRLLNYLMLEATFAPPSYPQLQLIARIHHRSGAYGLYHAGNSGSNVLGLGIRYLFD